MKNSYFSKSGLLSLLIITTSFLAFLSPTLANDLRSTQTFLDLTTDSPESIAAKYLAQKNIIKGKRAGEFDGEDFVNRAELSKFLLLSNNVQVEELRNDGIFSDLTEGDWYVKYVIKAEKLNIVNGYENREFKPTKTVNTVEFLKMLAKTFDLNEEPNTYADVKDQWYAEYAGIAQRYNLFPKRNKNLLLPTKSLTRNEVAVAIYQYLHQKNKPAAVYKKNIQAPVEKVYASTKRETYEGKHVSFSYLEAWELNNLSDHIITIAEPKGKAVDPQSNIVVQRKEISADDKISNLTEMIQGISDAEDLLFENIKRTSLNNITIDGILFQQSKTSGKLKNSSLTLIKTIGMQDEFVYSIITSVINKTPAQIKQFEIEHQNFIKSVKIFHEKRDLTNTTKTINTDDFELEISGAWDSSALGKLIIIDPRPEIDESIASLNIVKIELAKENADKNIEELEKQLFESDRFEFTDRVLISNKEKLINNSKFKEHIFTSRSGDVHMKFYRLVQQREGFLYVIVYSHETDKFSSLFNEIEQTIKKLIIK